MESKDWDSYLQKILGEFESGEKSHWEDLNSKLSGQTADHDDLSFPDDESLRTTLADYQPIGEVTGWEKVASSLDKADSEFDNEVADKVKHYEAPYNPDAWPLFLKHFSAYKTLRLKLIAMKIVEASAVVLLLFTVFQMNQKGSFPLFEKHAKTEATIPAGGSTTHESLAVLTPSDEKTDLQEVQNKQIVSQDFSDHSVAEISSTSNNDYTILKSGLSTTSRVVSIPAEEIQKALAAGTIANDNRDELSGLSPTSAFINNELTSYQADYITETLAGTTIGLKNIPANQVPHPVFVKPASKGHLEFGMLAQVDFNTLKMPQDILYTSRKQFVFPLQGIPSSGYGAGFTLAIAYDRWAIETGIIYNTKTFKPGRQLTVGEGTDHSSVEFEAMHIQLITMPVQARYKITPYNRFKLYAIAGLGMHIIAQSDIDVDVNYNFNSLPAGENPNNHPALAQTIRESQRLSDNFRQKAPFSTKSFISANLGIGVEYAVAERKTLFLQTTYQYQIPNLRFSNHNGKQLISTAIQAGVRTPMGF